MNRISLLVCLGLALGVCATGAQADIIYDFTRITSNAPTNIAGQFSAVLHQVDATHVTFTFYNNIGVSSSVTEVFFDNDPAGVLGSRTGMVLHKSHEIDEDLNFTLNNAAPPNLPSGLSIIPQFIAETNLGAEATHGHGSEIDHGIDESDDSVELAYSLATGKTWSDLLAAMDNGGLRAGLHVQGIEGTSDSFITPEPATLSLLALGGLAMLRRKRR